LLTYLALPAVIVRALGTATPTPDLIYLPLSALLVVLGLTLAGALILRPLGWDRSQAGAWMVTFLTFEGGAVGYPTMLLAFGEEGLSRLVLFDLAQAMYLLTVVYGIATWFGPDEISVGRVGIKLAKTPFFWAIWIGLGLNLLNWQPPTLLALLDILANSFVFLVLLLLGIEFQLQVSSVGRFLALALLKLGCGLGLGWGVATLFGLEGLERAAVLVGSALPPSMLGLLFAQEQQLDTRFVIGFISVSVPLYWVVMAPVLQYLGSS
jgi:predicted permease